MCRSPASAHTMEEARKVADGDRQLPLIIRPAFTLGGTGGGIAYNREEFEDDRRARARSLAGQRSADRGVAARLERIRDGGDARQGGQRRDHLLDRELRSDGRAHGRLDHRRADPDADRQGIPAMRDASFAVIREIGVETGGSNIQFAVNPDNGRMVVIEMNPRVSRSLRAGVEGDRFPDREDRGEAGRRLHAGRAAERHHPRDARRASSRRSTTW